ncbi:MAG: pyruvate ferredoxin oxidoreductase [Prevotella sp.]|nr:pyruvate ferredoxin oxidoreductase [Prevotella sp.]
MDYKYIEQLLERYWLCETSLEEERILRTFFSQENVPVRLMPYKDLFTYERQSLEDERLDEDFDRRMLEMVGEDTVKARTISLTERLKPLFKAAAIVAIFLTLGNAMQVALQPGKPTELNVAEEYVEASDGVSVAIADTMRQDSMKMTEAPLIK